MSSALIPSARRAQSPVLSPWTSLDFPPRQDDFETFKSLPRQLHLHCVQRLWEVFFFFLTACFVKIRAFNRGGRAATFSSKFHRELDHSWTPCLKQQGVQICSCGVASCFPLHYLSSFEEHTWRQIRGYSRFIKWDKMKQERWIMKRLTPCEKPVTARIFGAWGQD